MVSCKAAKDYQLQLLKPAVGITMVHIYHIMCSQIPQLVSWCFDLGNPEMLEIQQLAFQEGNEMLVLAIILHTSHFNSAVFWRLLQMKQFIKRDFEETKRF